MTIDQVKRIFYKLVKDANTGMTLNINKDEFSYVRFNYFENGNFYPGEYNDREYLGDEEAVDEEYDAEFSNGTANYIPTLRVKKPEIFFEHLYKVISKYIEFYNLDEFFGRFEEEGVIKNVILTILSNARYEDYANPIQYLDRYIGFFNDKTLIQYHNTIISNPIETLENSIIVADNAKDIYGYETPYAFHVSIKNEDLEYNLPIINYGISDNTCYIYSIQNKKRNDENVFNKKIKRKLNKASSGVENDTDYENKDTILGTTPSFIIALTIFFETLKRNNIDNVRVVTLLPDRYMEKLATSEYDADEIQHNLTEKMILLFYRLKHHIPKIDINFPIYDGYEIGNNDAIGEDLFVKLPETIECNNNAFLNEIISSVRAKESKNFER